MNRVEIFDLMRQAGFNTDWTGYEALQDTVAKYEKFAELVEARTHRRQFSNLEGRDALSGVR
jgi:hypothetical protein